MRANSGFRMTPGGVLAPLWAMPWSQSDEQEWMLEGLGRLGVSRRTAIYGSIQAALANDSILVTPGSGAVVATHTVGSKEHQVVMIAGNDGHIINSKDDWWAYYTPTTNAASREVGELFNADASAIARVRGAWLIPTQTAITGVQIGFDFNRISAVGTGGTTITPRPSDKNFAALNANITAHFNATGGATLDFLMWQAFFFNDETNASTPLQATYNQLPELGDRSVDITLRQNQGLQCKQSVTATVGLTGLLLYFTVE